MTGWATLPTRSLSNRVRKDVRLCCPTSTKLPGKPPAHACRVLGEDPSSSQGVRRSCPLTWRALFDMTRLADERSFESTRSETPSEGTTDSSARIIGDGDDSYWQDLVFAGKEGGREEQDW
jgi:hypothetical protein